MGRYGEVAIELDGKKWQVERVGEWQSISQLMDCIELVAVVVQEKIRFCQLATDGMSGCGDWVQEGRGGVHVSFWRRSESCPVGGYRVSFC